MQDHIVQLPMSVTSRVDVGRLVRELEAIDNYLESESVRVPDHPPQLPKTSRLLEDIRLQNKLNILDTTTRRHLRDFLESVRTKAPMLHMSFSADPSPLFIQKLVTWLRQEIHPLVLLQVGLQPTIGAGTIVRTTNKQFDFSLRNRFADSREVFISHMRHLGVSAELATSPTEIATPVEEVRA